MKETIGKQVLDKAIKYAGEKGPECREVTLAWGKSFNKTVEEIIKTHKDFAKEYYIVIYATKEIWSEQVVRIKIVIRKSKPNPEWRQCVYSYNNKTNKLVYHWALPHEKTCKAMLENEEGFDPKIIYWIKLYLANKLK